ncbi:hypothetical protein HDU67_005496 [Dinochytrium kinnereticum]|nr:hypothetical protein HDU67_005496 [Dinochytrium kinnereticum]
MDSSNTDVRPLAPLCDADFDESSWIQEAPASPLPSQSVTESFYMLRPTPDIDDPLDHSTTSWNNLHSTAGVDAEHSGSAAAAAEMMMDSGELKAEKVGWEEGRWTPRNEGRRGPASEGSSTPRTDEMMDVLVSPSIPTVMLGRKAMGWSSSSSASRSEDSGNPYYLPSKTSLSNGILFPQNGFKPRRQRDPLRQKKSSKQIVGVQPCIPSTIPSHTPWSRWTAGTIAACLTIVCAVWVSQLTNVVAKNVCVGNDGLAKSFLAWPYCRVSELVGRSLWGQEDEVERIDESNGDPVAAIALLVDSTDGHVIDIIQDLMSMPSSLNLSLSAHAAKSLAGTVRASIGTPWPGTGQEQGGRPASSPEPSSTTTDVGGYRAVADTLDDLATSLNDVSDAVLSLSTAGHASARYISRVLSNLFRAATSHITGDEVASQRHPHPKELQEMLDATLEAIDKQLEDLEVRLHWVRERSESAQSIWRQAEGASQYEVSKAKSRKAEYLSIRDEDASKPFKWFRSTTETHRVSMNLRMLRRTEEDLEVLQGVVGELKGMTPGLIKLDGDVKILRSDVQGLRGGLGAAEAVEAARVLVAGGGEGRLWTGVIWEKLRRLEDGVIAMRGQAPLFSQRPTVGSGHGADT